MALGLIALGMVRHVLQSRRFWAGVAVTAITLGSLRGMGQESRAGAMARLAAWNKRELQRLEHKAERQAGAVKNAAERMAHSAEGGKHGS
jgi:hypothetical protein